VHQVESLHGNRKVRLCDLTLGAKWSVISILLISITVSLTDFLIISKRISDFQALFLLSVYQSFDIQEFCVMISPKLTIISCLISTHRLHK